MVVQWQGPDFCSDRVSSSKFLTEGGEWEEILWGLQNQAFSLAVVTEWTQCICQRMRGRSRKSQKEEEEEEEKLILPSPKSQDNDVVFLSLMHKMPPLPI